MTTESEHKYDDWMDPECLAICDALNSLPGIATFESCCGHGRHPFWIFFTAESKEALIPILHSMPNNGRDAWKITATVSSANVVYFCLEGPELKGIHPETAQDPTTTYAQADRLASEIAATRIQARASKESE